MKKYFLLILFTSLIFIISYYIFCNSIFINVKNNYSSNNIELNKKNSIDKADDINKDNMAQNNLDKKNKLDNYSIQCANKVHITITEFINNQQCNRHLIKDGENINDILKDYSSSSCFNAYLKIIKAVNKINSMDEIKSGMILYIPEITLKNGTTYKIEDGDTWSKICKQYYPVYDLDSIMNLLIYINDFNDDKIPLGKTIFLPNI